MEGRDPSPPPELRLLPAWSAPFEVFAKNLFDCMTGRVVPVVELSSAPDHAFWRDIDLQSRFPRRGLIDSVLAHAALLGLLYAVSIWPQATVHLTDSRSYRTLNSYRPNQYLPELHGAPAHRTHGGKADPVPAQQEIRSLPDAPDNLRQTIVTPPRLKLQHDVDLPNLVAYESAPPAQPLEASSRSNVLPLFMPAVLAPAAETGSLHSSSKIPSLIPEVVEPAPEIVQIKPQRALLDFQPNVVQPAPEVGSTSRRGNTSLAQLLPSVAPVPASPNVGDAHMPQVVALSLHPAAVQAPLAIPQGNRSGDFAASPLGHPNAQGTPGPADSLGLGARDDNATVNAPPGISVGAPPLPVAAPNAPSPTPDAANPALRAKLLAAMRPTAIASVPAHRPLPPATTTTQSELETRIFAGRRSYTLVVNMPNLNSTIGSWIIHYVERTPDSSSSLIARPEVASKSDPAYPGQLIHDHVQGTVVLTAIIRADGTVSDIAVAKSLDPELDRNAARALSRWLFHPALKNGHAIDLEAVITVPFRATGL